MKKSDRNALLWIFAILSYGVCTGVALGQGKYALGACALLAALFFLSWLFYKTSKKHEEVKAETPLTPTNVPVANTYLDNMPRFFNFVQIDLAQNLVTIHFGMQMQGEKQPILLNRMITTPQTAKEMLLLLSALLQEYEARFGKIVTPSLDEVRARMKFQTLYDVNLN